MKYEIIGNVLPAVEITFDHENEAIVTQSGGMSWMSEGVRMDTNMRGGFMKSLGRSFAGESMFMVTYTAERSGSQIAFSSTVPGQILAIEASEHPGMILQKGAFLCSEKNVNVDVVFTKKFSSGLFGGEGFILQSISGQGKLFLEIDGNTVLKELAPNETLLVDTGNVVAFDSSIQYEIKSISGTKNILFGGEGLFVTKLSGAGKVLIQTQNFSDFAGRISALIPSK